MSHKLELETNEVNFILGILANQPYGEVFNLINKIQQQAEPVQPAKLAAVKEPAIKEEKSERKGNKGTTKKK